MIYTSQSKSDFPVVGDWVAISEYDTDKVLIHSVYPRTNTLKRQAIGKHGEEQIIASNIDVGFIVLSVDRDFSINRIERYLTLCYSAGITPEIIINKIDTIDEATLENLLLEVKNRLKNTDVIAFSNVSLKGIDILKRKINKGKTYCLLGSSGVGKSTLVNTLLEKNLMDTDSISESTGRGKHITTYRELFVLKDGGIIIDNPGMREVGITEGSKGLEDTFDLINSLAESCKFGDCTHTSETGCAVKQAVENGELDADSYHNYLNLEREREQYESSLAEKRKKDKQFGKMVKEFKKIKKGKK
jgi:ribosome biogenesis GTPase